LIVGFWGITDAAGVSLVTHPFISERACRDVQRYAQQEFRNAINPRYRPGAFAICVPG
jgi:hypothetical protein